MIEIIDKGQTRLEDSDRDPVQELLASVGKSRTSRYEEQKGLFDFEPYKEKKYPSQDWKAYDLAKTNQDISFKKLLQELLLLAVEEDKPKSGRTGYSKKDKLFCMAIKIFYKSDLRKCESMLKELKRLHYIDKVPCFKSIDNFFNDESLFKVLDDLIFISALPLANLEEFGAIDATGFSLSKFEQWSEYKWGKPTGKERMWRKAHAVCGCKTNVFLSVKVTEKNVADVSMVEKAIEKRIKYFDMKNFVADKAYSSRKVLQFIEELGLNPYIPFKKNARSHSKGCPIWNRLFHEFIDNNQKFLEKYHTRSNIETCFFMVKQKFGDHLMTKNYKANVNEIKMKFLCHNLLCLIQEVYESNVDIDFFNCVKIASSVKE